MNRCIFERVITAKLHRRRRLSPWRRGAEMERRGQICPGETADHVVRLRMPPPPFSAVRQQLFGSSVAPNRFHVSGIRTEKLNRAGLMCRLHPAERRPFIGRPSAGRHIATCHNLFSSVHPAPPPPPYISPPPAALSCSITLTPSLCPFMQCHHSSRDATEGSSGPETFH